MAVKIRLKRLGKVRVPQYRIVVVDERKKRDGKVIEEIGKYRPKEDPSFIDVESDRAQYWLGVGAQPSDAVAKLLMITGDWQKFKGKPGAEGRLKVAEPKRDKQEIFNEALKDAQGETKSEAVTKKAAAKKTAEKKAEKPADPVAEPVDSSVEPADPVAEPTDPVVEPVETPAAEDPAPVPADETPEGASEAAEAAEAKTEPGN